MCHVHVALAERKNETRIQVLIRLLFLASHNCAGFTFCPCHTLPGVLLHSFIQLQFATHSVHPSQDAADQYLQKLYLIYHLSFIYPLHTTMLHFLDPPLCAIINKSEEYISVDLTTKCSKVSMHIAYLWQLKKKIKLYGPL